MSANACPRCLKPLPESTRRALAPGTKCPYCAAPLKPAAAKEPNRPAAPADDGYASFELDGPPPPPSRPSPEGYDSFEVSAAPTAKPVAPLAAKVALPGTAGAAPRSVRATMVGGAGVAARDLPFDGAAASPSIALAPPVSAPAAAPPVRAAEPAARPASATTAPAAQVRGNGNAAALARNVAAPPPARTPSLRAALAPAAGRPARSLTPAQALDLPPPTPPPVLKTPVPVLKPSAAAVLKPPAAESDLDEPTDVKPPMAPEPAAATPLLTFPDSDPVIASVTVAPDVELPPAAGALPAPQESRRGLALMAAGMGIAIFAIAIGGFKLLRGARTSAAPAAMTVAQATPPAAPTAPVVEAVKPASASGQPTKAARAPAAKAPTTPTTIAMATRPAPRAPARAAVETPAAEHRRTGAHKAKPHPRHPSHARAIAMREAAAKRTSPPAPAPERADPRPPYEHGNALLFAGDGKGALAAYRQAVRSAPSDPIGFRGLGLAYEQEGQPALAIRALRRYLKLAPDAPDREIISRRIDKLSKRAKSK